MIRQPREVPSGRVVRGRLVVPPSKSVSHRLFNLSLLAAAEVVIENPLDAEDTRLFRAALRDLGWGVEDVGSGVRLAPPTGPPSGIRQIGCGNAGTMFRFLTATLTVLPGRFRLDGVPRLRERPVGPLIEALRRLGARITCPVAEGYAPLEIEGETLAGGEVRLDAGQSSQFLSAVLMAAARAPREVSVEVGALTSAPYIEVTLRAIELFGGTVERPAAGRFRIRPSRLAPPAGGRLRVEGDFSAACYPAAAAALTGGTVTLAGLDPASRQGDRGFLDLLSRMGARVEWRGDEVVVEGSGLLRGVDVDLGGMPDQVPTLAALAPFAEGSTIIRGVPHLRIKESDRLAAMASELGKLGAQVEERADGLVIPGRWSRSRPPATPVVVEPHGDHRIAMSLAVAGLRRPAVTIADPGVVGKSYPAFWSDLERLIE